jgi:hypothetical protein
MEGLNSTIFFLRMAAIELRRLAERFPELADELLPIAQQLDAEAHDLASHSRS